MKEVYTDEFNLFWKNYPKREADSKYLAYKAWIKAIKIVDIDKINEAVNIYKQMPSVLRGYNKLCATWLNQRCWETILEDKKSNSTKSFIESLKG